MREIVKEELYEEAYRELMEEGYRIEDIDQLVYDRVDICIRIMRADLDNEDYYE